MTDKLITVSIPASVWVDVVECLDADANSASYAHLPLMLDNLRTAVSAIDEALDGPARINCASCGDGVAATDSPDGSRCPDCHDREESED